MARPFLIPVSLRVAKKERKQKLVEEGGVNKSLDCRDNDTGRKIRWATIRTRLNKAMRREFLN